MVACVGVVPADGLARGLLVFFGIHHVDIYGTVSRGGGVDRLVDKKEVLGCCSKSEIRHDVGFV